MDTSRAEHKSCLLSRVVSGAGDQWWKTCIPQNGGMTSCSASVLPCEILQYRYLTIMWLRN